MSFSSFISSCFIFILLSFDSFYMHAQTPPIPNGRRLRDIIEDKYPNGNLLVGGTTGRWAFGRPTGIIMDREFSYVTPENDFKQWQIHPDNSNTWNWSTPDGWKAHVVSNNQILRMHGPIGPQCSNWAKADNRTAEELETNMRAFMRGICERYNGIDSFNHLDVVNEVVIGGQWHENKPGTDWEMPWFIIGQDTDKNKTPLYIKYAFEIAHEYAPDVKLVFNQHEGTINQSSWNKIKETIQYLRDLGLRVDGIGWQGHIDAGWEKIAGQQDALRNLIDWAHQNSLDFHITECDVGLPNNLDASLKAQADTYKAILDILIEKSINGLVSFNTWAIDDRNSWRGDEFAALFDENYEAKPAYYAIQLALEAKGDYTTMHNIVFQIKNTESGNPVENSLVTLNEESKYTDENGEVSFAAKADFYNVSVEKRHYNSVFKKNISVYTDTLLTLMLDSAEVFYNIKFQLLDKTSGEKLSAVEVNIDNQQATSGLDGSVDFVLNPGTYTANFTKTNYSGYATEYSISSDTILNVFLERSHGNVKFRIRNGSQPVNNALVVLGIDSLYTGALGICTFKSIPLDSIFPYFVERQYFNPIEGTLSIVADTTVDLKLEKTVGNIEFRLSTDLIPIQNAYVIIDNDTAWFNASNSTSFFNYELDMNYSFIILSDNYPDYTDSFRFEKDTILNVALDYTTVQDFIDELHFTIYPNPAVQILNIKSTDILNSVEIIDAIGHLVKQVRCNSVHCEMDISDLPPGYYMVRANSDKYKYPIVRKFSKSG